MEHALDEKEGIVVSVWSDEVIGSSLVNHLGKGHATAVGRILATRPPSACQAAKACFVRLQARFKSSERRV